MVKYWEIDKVYKTFVTHTYTHTHTDTYTHTHKHTHKHTSTQTHTNTQKHIYTKTDKNRHKQTQTHTNTHTHHSVVEVWPPTSKGTAAVWERWELLVQCPRCNIRLEQG